MGRNKFHHSVGAHREMYVRCVLETLFTSVLLLSRGWARPSDAVCDEGRGEGDKWFDGCRWCVCQRSGPMCSSAECSPLASQVLPCQKLDSGWSDGCYDCKCNRHGIECTTTESCRLLMRTERFYTDFLSREACVNPKDDRCVCGFDGVPSCTAEVIDRNAFPVTTIGLNPVFPASSSLAIRNDVYYQDHNVRSDENIRGKIPTQKFYSGSSYINYRGDRRTKRTIEQHRLRHSLSKRQTNSYIRHTFEFSEDSYLPKWRTQKEAPSLEKVSFSDSDVTETGENFHSKAKHKMPRKGQLGGTYESGDIRETSEGTDGEILDDLSMNYEPDGRNQKSWSPSPSLLITSDNRCRWGVRWYGGSLRCYCDVDNSITCGDPNFVTSHIDGFLLKSATCEEGQVWEVDNSCQKCECRINGVLLCRRSCPLNFLINPPPVNVPDDSTTGNKELIVDHNTRHSEEQTDELTGQTDYTIDLDNPNPTSTEYNMPSKKDSINIVLTKQSTNKDTPEETSYEYTLLPNTNPDDPEEYLPTSPEINFHLKDINYSDLDSLSLVADSTSPSNGIINQENNAVYETTDSNEEDGNSKSPSFTTILGTNKNNEHTDSVDGENNAVKRTTQVIVGECKPKSRWREGCKLCECGQDGKKLCDDSRCLKPMSVSLEVTDSSDFGVKQPSRPVQRPPSELYLSRDKPIDLSPAFLSEESCGRFTVGQKYWEDCNMCVCTSQGPKCTAKNCS